MRTEQLEILRRIAERGLQQAHSLAPATVDIWQHMLDEIGRTRILLTLRVLQHQLPWAIPYSPEFRASQQVERHRHLMHDLLHVYKSLGRIAAMAEKIDHAKEPGLDTEALAQETADLVICALHIANTNPLGVFDLQHAVLASLDRRNGSDLLEWE